MATKPAKSAKSGKGGKAPAKATKPAAKATKPAAKATAPAPAPAPAPVAPVEAVVEAPVAPAPAEETRVKSANEKALDRYMGDALTKKISQVQLDQLGVSRSNYHPLNNRIGRYKMDRGSMFDDFTISVA